MKWLEGGYVFQNWTYSPRTKVTKTLWYKLGTAQEVLNDAAPIRKDPYTERVRCSSSPTGDHLPVELHTPVASSVARAL